ncbi:MAG: hypothetical protein ABEK36_02805, partial [Candidatus Aenigmatarchaeota archaeon]
RFFSTLISQINFNSEEKQIYEEERIKPNFTKIKGYEEAKDWVNYINIHNEKNNYSKKDKTIKRNIEIFKNAINEKPHIPKNYRYLGDIYLLIGKDLEASKYYVQGIKVDPDYRDFEENGNYAKLRDLLKKTKNETVKKNILQFKEGFLKNKPLYSKQLSILSEEEFLEWLKSDLKLIINKIRKENVSLIIHNYHPWPNENKVGRINSVLENVAREKNVTFVDNEKSYRIAWKNGEDMEKFYVKIAGHLDVHPSTYGQKITAKNIYKKIRESGFLD